MVIAKDITGEKFGRLTVIEKTRVKGRLSWICQCECGNTIIASLTSLQTGNTKSCGCLRKEVTGKLNKKHGMRRTRLYNIYQKMLIRCRNSNDPKYPIYGGRGIKVCDEWKNNFENFYLWAFENGYSDELTIDRIDVNGDYEPSNCRWVDNKTQANNKRNNRLLVYRGKSHTLAEWADITGIGQANLNNRLNKLNWSVEEALSIPVRRKQ